MKSSSSSLQFIWYLCHQVDDIAGNEVSLTKHARGDSGKEPNLHRWQNREKRRTKGSVILLMLVLIIIYHYYFVKAPIFQWLKFQALEKKRKEHVSGDPAVVNWAQSWPKQYHAFICWERSHSNSITSRSYCCSVRSCQSQTQFPQISAPSRQSESCKALINAVTARACIKELKSERFGLCQNIPPSCSLVFSQKCSRVTLWSLFIF